MSREAGILCLLSYSSFDKKMNQQCAFSEKKSGQEGTAICSDSQEWNSEGWHQVHGLVWQ